MFRSLTSFVMLSACITSATAQQKTGSVWLDELPIRAYAADIRPVKTNGSYSNDSLLIGGVYYTRGIGIQTASALSFGLNGKAKRFTAVAGTDDRANPDIALQFYVVADKKVVFASGRMKARDKGKPVDIDLRGVQQLGLLVVDSVGGVSNKRTNGDWAMAHFEMEEGAMPQKVVFDEAKYILTPKAPATPRINGAMLVGCTPGNPFLYTVAATGARPMHFTATNLPKGLILDENTGIITGSVAQPGTYKINLTAKNKLGVSSKLLEVRIGDTIALTPPMGWNGWNAWETLIDREKVIASADAMVVKGLKDHGWSYINIDDSWQGVRGGPLNALQPNEKFPAIKEMVDHIHSIGLKAGTYSTPYISSYGGYPGASSDFPHGGETHASIMKDRRAFNHVGKFRLEKEDAQQLAAWGFDFLKYDWRIDTVSTRRMSEALRHSGRDIVLSLSNSAPFANVQDWMRLSNMYRTGPDIQDTWLCLYITAFSLDKWSPYGGHGHWNDADMMVVGNVSIGSALHPTRLTPDEQYAHVSLFSQLASPMLLGAPIEQLDEFTVSLLSNDEVLAVNQDPLAKPARLMAEEDGMQVWMRPLYDGSYSLGIYNTDFFGQTPASWFKWGNEPARPFKLDLAKLGLTGKWNLRDVWRQKDIGSAAGTFVTSPIRHHGVLLLRVSKTVK